LLYFSTDKQQTYWSEQRLQPCDAHNQCFQKHNIIEALQCLYKYPQELLYILICDAFTCKGTSKIILCFIVSYNYGNQVMQTQFKNALKMVNIVTIFYIEYYILKLKISGKILIF